MPWRRNDALLTPESRHEELLMEGRRTNPKMVDGRWLIWHSVIPAQGLRLRHWRNLNWDTNIVIDTS